MQKTIHEIIANNIKQLMEHHDQMSQTALGKKTGISQRTISNVINPGSVGSITTETIEKLAYFFKLEPYHLMIDNLSIEELLSKQIEKVIECYVQTTSEGRENIKRIAENEMRYCEKQPERLVKNSK